MGSDATDRKLEVTDRKPRVTDRKLRVADRKPRVTDRKPRVTDRKPRVTDRMLENTGNGIKQWIICWSTLDCLVVILNFMYNECEFRMLRSLKR